MFKSRPLQSTNTRQESGRSNGTCMLCPLVHIRAEGRILTGKRHRGNGKPPFSIAAWSQFELEASSSMFFKVLSDPLPSGAGLVTENAAVKFSGNSVAKQEWQAGKLLMNWK